MVLYLDAANPKNYNLTAVEVLVVAGGGGGGAGTAGGGGGGGLIYNSNFAVTPGSALTVTVGAGGTGKVYAVSNSAGDNGGNSVFGSLTATGGGGGGNRDTNEVGKNGGSGGGGGGAEGGVNGAGTGTSGQGFAGGTGRGGGGGSAGGGGGGAGGVGQASPSSGLGGNGGPGLGFNISGTFTYYGGGGGGGSHTGRSSGGIGGGGAGSENGPTYNAVAGTTNTGGGGGGGGGAAGGQFGGNGGSGIVIVRYQGPQKAIGGTITSNNGYTIHTFTTVETTTFTPLVATNNSAILGLSDFSGGGNFATSVNGPTYSSSSGGSLSFDGTNDFVNIGIGKGVNQFSADFAVSAWVFRNAGGPTFGNVIGDYYTGSVATTNEWQIMMSNTAQFNFYRVGSNYVIPNTASGYSASQWINVVVSRIGSTISMYANNNLIATATNSTVFGTATGNLNIGIDGDNSSEPLSGRISNVMIYKDKGLTSAEVSQNYNALKSRFIQDGSSADRAAPSASYLSSIGIRADGDYWYLPPGQTTPIQLYTVFSSAPDGKGYVLVARGRESTDWWNTSGQNTSALTSTSINTNTPIAVLSNSFVNSLINSQWNGMRFITNRINGGDSWLFVGTTSTTFSWTYFQQSASTVNATATKYNSLFLSGGVALNWGSGVHWTDTLNYGGGNNCDRTFTWSWAGHGPYQGWSGGSSCTPAGSFQNGGEGHSIQLVNCYVEC
jgi:hypothetical protein